LPLETRQWDYKFGEKNPLFRALTEERRRDLYLGRDEERPKAASPDGKRKLRSRTRSNSESGERKSRSSSGQWDSDPLDAAMAAAGGDFGFSSADVRHVQQELEVKRTQRSAAGARGCTCRKLHVYIPPAHAGKKAAHRRLNVPKVKDELRARQALSPAEDKRLSREELEERLAALVEKEPCCGPDCECRKNGIECQSDTCTCWWSSHHHKKAPSKTKTQRLSLEEIRVLCGNAHGMFTVDLEAIDDYRKPFYTCQPAKATHDE
jgi:hypothetical protein